MGMSYLEAARIMMGGGSGNVGPKPDTIVYNGTYVAEDDDLDGYTQVVVALPLGGATFTENRSYTPPDNLRGWSSVTVQVKTWEDEYNAMMECCQDVAEILGAEPEPGQSCCDAVKAKAQEVIDENEEYEKCRESVIEKLQEYDPNFDPQTCQDITDKIDDVVDDAEGYEFPPDTDIRDLEAVTGGNPITDTTTGVTVEIIHVLDGDSAWYPDEHQYFNAYSKIRGIDYFPQIEPYTSTCYQAWYMKITNSTTTYTWSPGWDQSQNVPPVYNSEGYDQLVSASIDPTTGFVEWIIEETYPGYSPSTRRYIGTLSDLIGYGADGHTYKVSSGSNQWTPETTPT